MNPNEWKNEKRKPPRKENCTEGKTALKGKPQGRENHAEGKIMQKGKPRRRERLAEGKTTQRKDHAEGKTTQKKKPYMRTHHWPTWPSLVEILLEIMNFSATCSIRGLTLKETMIFSILFWGCQWWEYVIAEKTCRYWIWNIFIDFLAIKKSKKQKNAKNAHSGPGRQSRYWSENFFDHIIGFSTPKLV